MLRSLVLVLALGCSSGGQTISADLTVVSVSDLAGRDFAGADLSRVPDLAGADLTVTGSACNAPGECRLYSNNCDGCACQALRTDEIDPVCAGSPVSCFVDPCDGRSSNCVMGHCVVE